MTLDLERSVAISQSRDRVLAAWWDQLVTEDRLDDLFDRAPRTFTAFRTRLEGRPVYAAYTAHDDGLELGAVLWGIPWFKGLKLGLWVPSSFRRTRAGLAMIEDLIALALAEYPVLVATARNPANGRLYQKYGFRGMTIPDLSDGDVWLGWMTPATWRRRTKETPA